MRYTRQILGRTGQHSTGQKGCEGHIVWQSIIPCSTVAIIVVKLYSVHSCSNLTQTMTLVKENKSVCRSEYMKKSNTYELTSQFSAASFKDYFRLFYHHTMWMTSIIQHSFMTHGLDQPLSGRRRGD